MKSALDAHLNVVRAGTWSTKLPAAGLPTPPRALVGQRVYSVPMPLEGLPGWVVDDVASVLSEVARYRDATVQELWRYTEDCAKDAMWAVRASPFPERVLSLVDPLPSSSVIALRRLWTGKE